MNQIRGESSQIITALDDFLWCVGRHGRYWYWGISHPYDRAREFYERDWRSSSCVNSVVSMPIV